MTLEEIKNRQTELNIEFNQVVNNLKTIIAKIVGEDCKETLGNKEEPQRTPNGLLEEIESYQDYTKQLIDFLYAETNKLGRHTYTPSDEETTSK